jgi:regulator of replication initiation timing
VKSKEDEKIADLEADIRRLMDENISLTAEHTSLAVNLDTEQRKNE